MNPVTAYWDVVIELGQTAQLLALGNGTFTWSPAATLNDSTSASPIASPSEATTYTVTMTDINGCITTDEVTIIVPGSLFIPNTFTPNGDGYNDAFGAWGTDITEIELNVFNRWGELIWSSADLGGRWDGTYQGNQSPIDTYVWKVRAREIAGEVHERVGHVNLIR
jgi:gliding motility-associated-like protein